MHNITSSLSLSLSLPLGYKHCFDKKVFKNQYRVWTESSMEERVNRDIKISFVNQIPCHNFYFLTLLLSCSGAINPTSRPWSKSPSQTGLWLVTSKSGGLLIGLCSTALYLLPWPTEQLKPDNSPISRTRCQFLLHFIRALFAQHLPGRG